MVPRAREEKGKEMEQLFGVRLDGLTPEILVVPARVRDRLEGFGTAATIVSGRRWEVLFADGYGGYVSLRNHSLIERARDYVRAQKKKK